MDIKVIDTRGKLCPEPLIMTRAAIRECAPGVRIGVCTDNRMACANIVNYLSELDIAPDVSPYDQGGEGCYMIAFDSTGIESADGNISCPTETVRGDGYGVVVLKSHLMGEGDPELGALLLRSYLNTLSAMASLPSYILAYNGGVKCAVGGCDTAAALSLLEEKGVKVILCGTCVDFYGLKDKTVVGEIGNMLRIAEILADASTVIYP